MSTLRTIEPIDVRGLTPQAPATGAPICEHVDPRTLVVDPAYQRSLGERSIRQIRRIIESFDWSKFKPPVCAFSEGEDGVSVLKIIDGQHTAIAAASNPHIATIPVMIVEAKDIRAQASAFIGQNTDRLGVTATQLHVAAVAAGDEDALGMAAVCERAGVTILKNPPSGAYKPGDTVAVAAIGALMKKEGSDHAGHVLRILSAAGLAPIKADHVKAVDRLLTEAEFGAIDPDALPSSILGYPAAMQDAKTFAATHGLPLWKALAAVWFKKAKKRRKSQVEDEKPLVRAGPLHDGSRFTTMITLPDDVAEGDTRPALGAWSPGNHVRRCAKCDERFRGGRLAMECAGCAYGGSDAP